MEIVIIEIYQFSFCPFVVESQLPHLPIVFIRENSRLGREGVDVLSDLLIESIDKFSIAIAFNIFFRQFSRIGIAIGAREENVEDVSLLSPEGPIESEGRVEEVEGEEDLSKENV